MNTMRFPNSVFFKYLLSFGIVILVSLIALFATSYFGSQYAAPETTCITSSGQTC